MDRPRIVIAGTHSGVGKTSLSLGIVAALRKRGLNVQTFKVGPDFLDPTHLALASGRPCYNLDGWMAGRDYVSRLFARASENADISVIEGVMGLFDGAVPDSSEGSTAEIARWLDAPVLLVTDVHGMARSIGAVVAGFSGFEKDLRIAGVIANRCGSERHAAALSASLAAAGLPPLAGAVMKGGLPDLPSRHLGLVTADAGNLTPQFLGELAAACERQGAMDQIIRIARGASPLHAVPANNAAVSKPISIGIARDAAFHFYYQDFFDELEMRGCTLEYFSPLADDALPDRIDALYIGGGYPEEYAEALSANVKMLGSVRAFAALNRPMYAECGGLMYLCRSLEKKDGTNYPMAGLVPTSTRMLDRRKFLGYVEVTLNRDSLWGAGGATIRGHEFHYSELTADPAEEPAWQAVYSMKRRRDGGVSREGFQKGRTLASYAHLHLASRPDALGWFIDHLGATQ